jgi:thioester reductase-like protein
VSAATIATIAARIARVPDHEVTPGMPFAMMGLDSAGAIELAFAIEEALGIDLPPEAVAECGDASTLAARVDAVRRTQRSDAPRLDPFELMLADAVLPETIRPPQPAAANGASLTDASRILLTGVTGFLGRWLARTLIDRSSSTLVCIVRSGREEAAARLRQSLSSAGIDGSAIDERVAIVDGDLDEPWLGLNRSRFDALAGEVDAVCHAGAMVNWVLPYRALRGANVASTRDLLTLAAHRGLPFHFVSSLSVCYSTLAPDVPDERFDALAAIRGLHFGYAQTKAVAEALVRQAGERGLPVAIYRPSFIAGHGSDGAYNRDDILARTVSGCVRMGTAPDLDWTLDCVPVDIAAHEIVQLSTRRGMMHLAHARPRHWRECVLWMRLYGYDVRLVPYHAWLRQLDRETSADRSHPLAPLRSFFLGCPADARGQTLPELMLRTAVAPGAVRDPDLDAALLQRYFDAFVARGDLHATPRTGSSKGESRPNLDAQFFARVTGLPVASAKYEGRLSEHSIISELTAWHSGRPTGLFRYRLDGVHSVASNPDVVVKIKPEDRTTIAVGEALARLCDDRAGAEYARWADRLGFAAGHTRELAIYAQQDPRFTRHTPRLLGAAADPATETWTLVLERIERATLQDSVDRPDRWTADHLEHAIEGLAALHAISYGREDDLRSQPWIGYVPRACDVAEMTDFWRALASHASSRFSAWADPAIGSIQRSLVADVERWWQPLEALPRTLIHNDFNPRNICLRDDGARLRLCAYDWELAAIGVPQHDLAELLCFVLPSDVITRDDVQHWVDRHRILLEREIGVPLDRADWALGFRAALRDLMLNRLPMYALVHRIRPQSFLPRVIRTWRKLYELYR